MTRLLRRLNAAAIFLAVIGASPAAQAGLTLDLIDGSLVTVGEVAGADELALTVAAVAPGVRIQRTIPWPRIAGAVLDGERYSTGELRTALRLGNGGWGMGNGGVLTDVVMPVVAAPASIPFPAPPCCLPFPIPYSPFPIRPPGRIISVRPDPIAAYADLVPAVYPDGIPSTEAPFALALLRERRRLETVAPFVGPVPGVGPAIGPVPGLGPPAVPAPSDGLPLPVPGGLSQVEARVMPLRSGGGADVNGLSVELVGFDVAGNAVPVEGTAQAFLYAGRQELVHAFGGMYAPRPEGLIRLAEWTRAAEPGRQMLLPLSDPLPEHDPHVSDVGTLRVRVSVPGSGVFETLAEPVVLRPTSALREVLRAETGTRFLPDERTTGRASGAWPRQRDFTSVE